MSCKDFIDYMTFEIVFNNQISWFKNLKKQGFKEVISNPKLQTLKNKFNHEIPDYVFILCCYIVEYNINEKYKINDLETGFENMDII